MKTGIERWTTAFSGDKKKTGPGPPTGLRSGKGFRCAFFAEKSKRIVPVRRSNSAEQKKKAATFCQNSSPFMAEAVGFEPTSP
ncbi:MAG: hypothetical protein IJL26_12250 [Clostridia bacterium]|nr:hypothetical protein [Clostridia bacterium]